MKKAILCVLLTLSMSVSAFALEVPTDTVVQNLNGSQQVIKTFTIPADQDPQSLIEQPFELEGYLYTFTDIVKTENAVEESKPHTEVITVETDKNDLALILQQLKPTVEFDDGTFKGTLALDHTSLNTEASGYAAKSYTVSEVKTIGRLDRNDMSYVPSATIKNGRTLSLADVEWQVTGTDLVGETLVPSSYQAVATYSARVPYGELSKCSVFDYVPEWKRREEENEKHAPKKSAPTQREYPPDSAQRSGGHLPTQEAALGEERPHSYAPASCASQMPAYGEHGAVRQHKSPPMPRQTSGASCIYDFPDMKGTAPDDIGLVEMSRSEIAGDDAPELEELDDEHSRIPPGRGI